MPIRVKHYTGFHPDLLRGVSTYWWEFLRAAPQLNVVYVPIGQGSGACSAIAAKLALQHLGRAAFHARALAGRHDEDVYGCHGMVWMLV